VAQQVGAGILVLFVGTAFLVLSYGMWNHERHRAPRGVLVPGTIIGHGWRAYGTGGDATPVMVPIVRFHDLEGREREFVHRAGTNVTRPQPSRDVTVWYDPEIPDENPVIHGEAVMRAFPWIFGFVGVVAEAVGLGLFWAAATGY
jgi:hypothetical protein